MSKPQVLVSGATGFIGQHLIPLLLESHFEVIAICRDEAKAKNFDWHDKVQWHFLDYHRDSFNFRPQPGAGLIHLAWQGLPNYTSAFHIDENLPQNYAFVKALVDEGVKHVLAVGTCLEYGFQYGPLSTATSAKPTTPYAIAKNRLHGQLIALQERSNFILQWARLFYMYGKGQNPKSILAQLDAAIDRHDITFNMSGGEQLRDYLPVEEVAKQLLQIFRGDKNGTVNVCSGKPISIRRLVEQRIQERNSSIRMNLGYYPYPEFEPMAFWGER